MKDMQIHDRPRPKRDIEEEREDCNKTYLCRFPGELKQAVLKQCFCLILFLNGLY